jgi:hypothetical protein
MKAHITSKLHFVCTENFKKELGKLIPNNIKDVWLISFKMEWLGYGSYIYHLRLAIDDKEFNFKYHTNDSESYDFWKRSERNKRVNDFEKRRILSLFEHYQDEINEFSENK